MLINYINLLEKYFEDHFDDPEEEYVNPESVPEGVTKKFKARLIIYLSVKKTRYHR